MNRYRMDISDYIRIVLGRIQIFEPEYATKIIGYLFFYDLKEEEFARLASCPDNTIREIAIKAKTELQNLAATSAIHTSSPPITPTQPVRSYSPIISPRTTAPSNFHVHPPSIWEPKPGDKINSPFMSAGYIDSIPEPQKHTQQLCAENYINLSKAGAAGIANDYFGLDALNMNKKSGVSGFPVKTCQYFIKGYCKHGNSCRYLHGQVTPESYYQMNGSGDNQGSFRSSLAELELELIELLRSKRGHISIASLPTAYHDKYKKVLSYTTIIIVLSRWQQR